MKTIPSSRALPEWEWRTAEREGGSPSSETLEGAGRMFRKGNPVERRLRKISKQEAASLKLLEKQEVELVKAVEENAREVETRLARETPAEAKLKAEIDRVTRRLANLTSDMQKVINHWHALPHCPIYSVVTDAD